MQHDISRYQMSYANYQYQKGTGYAVPEPNLSDFPPTTRLLPLPSVDPNVPLQFSHERKNKWGAKSIIYLILTACGTIGGAALTAASFPEEEAGYWGALSLGCGCACIPLSCIWCCDMMRGRPETEEI